ncbi:fimbrial protein [Pseudocitrobacter faecalis]|uniref:fimbrial protein n=1 Tax=Pseudocitrobacter faecalis TaxID=1398493 RepID=UPI0033153BD4
MLKHFLRFTAVFFFVSLLSSQLASASCGILLGSVKHSDKSINLSTAFTASTVYTVSYTTSWSGSITCTLGLGLDSVYFFSAFGSKPVYLNYTSVDGTEDYWVKVTDEITGTIKTTVNGIAGIHSLSSYQTQYTLTFEYLSEKPAGVTDYTKTSTSGSINIFPAIVSDSAASTTYCTSVLWCQSQSYADNVWDYMMNDTTSWSSSRYLGYEKISINFEPQQTTCNLTHDLTIKLPPATLDTLQNNGEAPGINFRLPISCKDALGDNFSTRDISGWLSSSDILNDATTGTVLVNEDSEAGGVGISVRSSSAGSDIIFSSDSLKQSASEIFSVKKDDSVESAFNVSLYAYYKVYDSAQLTTGPVVATAQLMLGYD